MDYNLIEEIITSLGFPIVCVLALGWFVHKIWQHSMDNMKEQITRQEQISKEREDKLFEQIDKFNNSLDNFNVTLIKIDTRLEYLENKLS